MEERVLTMDEFKPEENPIKDKDQEDDSKNGKKTTKKTIGRILGIEIYAPEGMKNPVLRLSILIILNLLLLALLRIALNN